MPEMQAGDPNQIAPGDNGQAVEAAVLLFEMVLLHEQELSYANDYAG